MSTLSRYYRTLTPSKIRVLQASGKWRKVILSHHDSSNPHHHHHDTNDSSYHSHTHNDHVFYINADHIQYIEQLIPIRTGKSFSHDHHPLITHDDDGTIHYHIYDSDHHHHNGSHHHHNGSNHHHNGSHHHHSNTTTHHHDGDTNHTHVTHTHGSATIDASNNLSLGTDSLHNLTVGINNTAIGYDTLHDITSGSNNLAVGNEALAKVTIGNSNVALGSRSLYNNVEGDSNTCIGYEAGKDITGDKNVIIGKLADTSAVDSSNEIVIGYDTIGIGSNMAVIGNDEITKLYAAHDGGAIIHTAGIVQTSDSRIKKNVTDLDGGLNFINSLRPVLYNKVMPKDYPEEIKKKMYPKGVPRRISNEECKKKHVGLIAQEVKNNTNLLGDEISNIVNYNIDTGLYSLSYDSFVVPIIQAIQELKKEKDEQIQNIMTKISK